MNVNGVELKEKQVKAVQDILCGNRFDITEVTISNNFAKGVTITVVRNGKIISGERSLMKVLKTLMEVQNDSANAV